VCFKFFSTRFGFVSKENYELQVPFGGAAFFPGRLIHTNELLVWFPLWSSFDSAHQFLAHDLHCVLGAAG
jgi:hypothetical protein